MKPVVAILMGSDSDAPLLKPCAEVLKEFGISLFLMFMDKFQIIVLAAAEAVCSDCFQWEEKVWRYFQTGLVLPDLPDLWEGFLYQAGNSPIPGLWCLK